MFSIKSGQKEANRNVKYPVSSRKPQITLHDNLVWQVQAPRPRFVKSTLESTDKRESPERKSLKYVPPIRLLA